MIIECLFYIFLVATLVQLLYHVLIFIRIWFGFPMYFIHKFFIRGMFRAGTYGFALSMSSAFGRWLKDIKQYENIIKSKKNK